ncbi:MAG TPA: hypothetical protein VHD83_05025 [Puia sp.]|nr:hypothetical protein [Puia sp.]
MDKEIFSPQDSLQVIQNMIANAKNSVADKSFYFLLWGWLVFIGCILQFTLKVIVKTELHPAAWNIMYIGFIVSFWHGWRERKRTMVKTYVDDTLRDTWIVLGISQTLVVLIFLRRYDTNILICAAAILVSYIIPGYLLRSQHRKTINA